MAGRNADDGLREKRINPSAFTRGSPKKSGKTTSGNGSKTKEIKFTPRELTDSLNLPAKRFDIDTIDEVNIDLQTTKEIIENARNGRSGLNVIRGFEQWDVGTGTWNSSEYGEHYRHRRLIFK